jgi:hypothetical protein
VLVVTTTVRVLNRVHRHTTHLEHKTVAIISSGKDPDPGSGAFLTPGSRMGKKSGSQMNNPNHISESLATIFWG